jgi:uncharacterized protein YeaO (DUF488 family)
MKFVLKNSFIMGNSGFFYSFSYVELTLNKGGAEMLTVKRVYEAPELGDGTRFLVERLWPRGMKKETLRMDVWLRDVAPSNALRRWFGHEPAKWKEFRRRYSAELDAKLESLQPILEAMRQGDVTLLYSAHDTEHNNAVALKEYLEKTSRG